LFYKENGGPRYRARQVRPSLSFSAPRSLNAVTIPRKDVEAKFKELNAARDKLANYFATVDKTNVENLNIAAIAAKAALFDKDCELLKKQVAANEKQIGVYQDQLNKLKPKDTISAVQDAFAISAKIPPAAPDVTPGTSTEADYWTSVTFEVSSSYSAEQDSSSANSFSVGGSARWGLWSVGGSVSHSDATSDVAKQMANSSIKASFDCMRVDISRSWMRGELFYDDDLRVAAGNL
jgi:hypothetical protein